MRRLPGPLLTALLSILIGAAGRAAPLHAEDGGDQRVATILVRGLERIQRERLLGDLRLREGDPYRAGLEARLESRAERLPYINSLRIESEPGRLGRHLTLWVREASRLRMRPFFFVLEDGDLAGGFHVDSDGLISQRERWRGTIFIGGRTELRLRLDDLSLGSERWPALNFDLGLQDWDHPFWDTQARSYWALAGPSYPAPLGEGRLLLLAGKEWLETAPPRGFAADGDQEQWLLRGIWRQYWGGALGLDSRLSYEERWPEVGSDYVRAELSLAGRLRRGLWQFSGRAATGRTSPVAPVTGVYFMDSWHYLRGFDSGSLPAREFHFLRLRADLRLFEMPVRLSRDGPERPIVYSLFCLAEGAFYRPSRSVDFADASDLGFGLGLRLPGPIPTLASAGILWNNVGEVRSVFMLEEF